MLDWSSRQVHPVRRAHWHRCMASLHLAQVALLACEHESFRIPVSTAFPGKAASAAHTLSAMASCELSQGTGPVHEAGGCQGNVDTVEGPHDEPCAAPNVHFWVVLDSCFRAYA